MFITRLLSGIVLVTILLATGILGGNILWGFCFLISIIGLYEFYKVFKIKNGTKDLCIFLIVHIKRFYIEIIR